MKKVEKMQQDKIKQLLKDRKFIKVPLNNLILPQIGIDSDTDLDKVVAAVKQDGLLTPISIVGPYKINGREQYKVIEGARRIKALRTLINNDEIPCYLVDGSVSQKDIELYALNANRVHRNSDNSLNLQYAQMVFEDCLKGKLKAHEMSYKLAEILGISQRQALNYLRIIQDGEDEIIEAVKNSEVPIKVAVQIVKSNQDQKALKDVYLESTLDQKKVVVDKIKKGENPDTIRKANFEEEKKAFKISETVKQTERGLSNLIEEELSDEEVERLVKLCEDFLQKHRR